MAEFVFLKLGGSLITDKTNAYTPLPDRLEAISRQVAAALQSNPGLSLLLGHGSGSFGHTAAKDYRTREGLPAAADSAAAGRYWRGFAEVWYQAALLNRYVMDALHQAGVPALAMAPAASVTAFAGKASRWDTGPIRVALKAGLVPVVYGDVIFDDLRGGTILSTEDLFEKLARELRPERILLAGLEAAVWADYPLCSQPLEKITPASFEQIKAGVGASHGADVTGGMESKVRQMLALVAEMPGLSARIFSGVEAGNIQKALAGESLGTLLTAE